MFVFESFNGPSSTGSVNTSLLRSSSSKRDLPAPGIPSKLTIISSYLIDSTLGTPLIQFLGPF